MLLEWVVTFMGNMTLLLGGWLGLGFFRVQAGVIGATGALIFDWTTFAFIMGYCALSATIIILCQAGLNYELRWALKHLEQKLAVKRYGYVPVFQVRIKARFRRLCREKELSYFQGSLLVGTADDKTALTDRETIRAWEALTDTLPESPFGFATLRNEGKDSE